MDDAGARREARRFVAPDAEVPDTDAALAGARDIVVERVAEDPSLRPWVRGVARKEGLPAAQGFWDYFDHAEPVRRIASHRVLALRRGEAEAVLSWGIELPEDVSTKPGQLQ